MKAAIYVRVSKKKEDGLSLDSQESLLIEYCRINSLDVYKIYRDNGKSGKTTDRDAYLELIQDAKKHFFDKVIIWRITRFGRNLKDLLNASDLFSKHNIALISYSENYDFSTAIGKLIRNIIGSVAEFELDEYSENIRMVLDEKAKRGGRMCHYVLGYNKFGKDGFVINEDEMKKLLKIYEITEKEVSILSATRKLNVLDIRGKNGRKLYPFSLMCILKRAMYCGYVEHNGNIYKSSYIPVIIPVQRYNKMQMKLYNRCTSNKNNLFIIIDDQKVLINTLTEEEIKNIDALCDVKKNKECFI